MNFRSRSTTLALGALLLLVQACGDSTSAPVPHRVVVTPTRATLEALGDTQQFTAVVEDKNGISIPGVPVSWSSSDPLVASINSSGLATALKGGLVSVQATSEGLLRAATLTIQPVPQEMVVVTGDNQTGALSQALPIHPTVELRDANGNPLEGMFVTFSIRAGSGTLSSGLVATDANGQASTEWSLGCSDDPLQLLEASSIPVSATFSAASDLSLPAICLETVPQGRETMDYQAALEVVGGDQSTVTWSLGSGALPSGLSLQTDGTISGTPTAAGPYAFEARVQDGQGLFASREYQLPICGAPLALEPGESLSVAASDAGGCGPFIPTGEPGDRYRLGILYGSSSDEETDVASMELSITRHVALGAPAEVVPVTSPSPLSVGPSAARPLRQLPPSFRRSLEWVQATEAHSRRMREAERELVRELGPMARPLPDRRSPERVSGPDPVAPATLRFTHPTEYTQCTLGSTVTGQKVAENAVMVIYQDSTERAANPLSTAHANLLLDYYRDYGKQVVDAYFGGVPDLNGDGQIIVLVTPEVPDGVAAFVWSGDFYPKTPQPGWAGCTASNTMELIRYSLSFIQEMSNGGYQALSTMVHEAKHVSSLYNSLLRTGADRWQPGWIEDGGGEIAAELSSRLAWEATGGPAVGVKVVAEDVDTISKENYGVLIRLLRTEGYLASQPNGVTVTPEGAGTGHSDYGSGWHFLRWVADAYGNASTRLGDAAFFRTQNAVQSRAGPGGVVDLTGGRSWVELLDEYAAAVMLNGIEAPVGPRAFTSYDFPSVLASFSYSAKPTGEYPWAVNVPANLPSMPFATATYSGTLGPSGIRVYDLTSDGISLGIEVEASSSKSPLRVVVARLR